MSCSWFPSKVWISLDQPLICGTPFVGHRLATVPVLLHIHDNYVMKSKRYCPYPVIHYNGNSLATTSANSQTAVVASSENYLYSSTSLPATSFYYYVTDPKSLSPMPYASPGKFLVYFRWILWKWCLLLLTKFMSAPFDSESSNLILSHCYSIYACSATSSFRTLRHLLSWLRNWELSGVIFVSHHEKLAFRTKESICLNSQDEWWVKIS